MDDTIKELEKSLEMLKHETDKLKRNSELKEGLDELVDKDLKESKLDELVDKYLKESKKVEVHDKNVTSGVPVFIMEYVSQLNEREGEKYKEKILDILKFMDIYFKFCVIKEEAHKKDLNSLKNNSNSEMIKNKANNVIKYSNKQNAGRKQSKELSKKLSFLSDKDDNNDRNEDGEINFRQRLTRFLELHDRLFYIKLIIYILSFLSFAYYVVCTYINSLFSTLNYIDFFICTIYMVEHLINIILAHHFFLYILSIESITSFLLEIPPFFSLLCKDYHLDHYYRFINITRVLRLLKANDILDLFWSGEKNVNSQIINIIATLVSMILVWGGIIQMLDLGYVERNLKITFDNLPRRNLLLRRHFHHYIYFVIVSLTTVGYGEIIPKSFFGQWMIILLVVVILVVVPDKTSELINLSNAQTIYERKQYISSP